MKISNKKCERSNPGKRSCELCDECIPIGEGDHLCTLEEPKVIIENYQPTAEYYWCKGKYFGER